MVLNMKKFLLLNGNGTDESDDGSPVTVNALMSTDKTPANQIPDISVGHKMLKMMGWNGGGLGAQQQGITIPVT